MEVLGPNPWCWVNPVLIHPQIIWVVVYWLVRSGFGRLTSKMVLEFLKKQYLAVPFFFQVAGSYFDPKPQVGNDSMIILYSKTTTNHNHLTLSIFYKEMLLNTKSLYVKHLQGPQDPWRANQMDQMYCKNTDFTPHLVNQRRPRLTSRFQHSPGLLYILLTPRARNSETLGSQTKVRLRSVPVLRGAKQRRIFSTFAMIMIPIIDRLG